MSVTVVYKANVTVTEVLPNNTGSASPTKRTVTHDEYDESVTLNAASTPPATTVAEFLMTLGTGAATVDLRALLGTNSGAIDGNGLKLQVLRVKNLGENNLVIDEGASNGYAIGETTIFPGGHVQLFFNDGSPDISGTDKTIDLAGTGSQTSEWTVILG